MTGAAIAAVLIGTAMTMMGNMWGLAPLALGVAVLIVTDGDSDGGGA